MCVTEKLKRIIVGFTNKPITILFRILKHGNLGNRETWEGGSKVVNSDESSDYHRETKKDFRDFQNITGFPNGNFYPRGSKWPP